MFTIDTNASAACETARPTQDGSTIEIWRLIAGALGAIIGGSLLSWISRTVGSRFMAERIARAKQNEQVAKTFEVLSDQAPQLIVFGRFVPGMRFVVGATMGVTRYRYASFLLWDAIGSTAWAAFACISSALVATVIDDQPVLSMLVSIVLTTALLGLFYRSLKSGGTVQQPPVESAPAGG